MKTEDFPAQEPGGRVAPSKAAGAPQKAPAPSKTTPSNCNTRETLESVFDELLSIEDTLSGAAKECRL